MKHTAYIGIGSNLGNRIQNCEAAVQKINAHPSIKVTKKSSWIETDPVGYTDQPKFINGAIETVTNLSPESLLETLLSIENEMGRVRMMKWGPRLIDLDILLYDEETIQTPQLIIPHPGLKERDFVRKPLLELNPKLQFLFNVPSNSEACR